MSATKFAFLPPNSPGATAHNFSFDFMLNMTPSGVSPYSTLPLVVTYLTRLQSLVKELQSHRHWTARLSYWVTDASLWLKQRRRKKSRSYHLCSSSPTPDLEPLRMEAPRLLMEAGNSSWSISLPCSPLCQLRIKATFLFPPNSASISLISDKAKILATNSVKAFEFSCTHWLSCCWNKSVSLYAKWA